jgi:hypothetical protein
VSKLKIKTKNSKIDLHFPRAKMKGGTRWNRTQNATRPRSWEQLFSMDPNYWFLLIFCLVTGTHPVPKLVRFSFNIHMGKWMKSKKWMMLNIFCVSNFLRRSNNLRSPSSFSERCIKYWSRSLFGQYWNCRGACPYISQIYIRMKVKLVGTLLLYSFVCFQSVFG